MICGDTRAAVGSGWLLAVASSWVHIHRRDAETLRKTKSRPENAEEAEGAEGSGCRRSARFGSFWRCEGGFGWGAWRVRGMGLRNEAVLGFSGLVLRGYGDGGGLGLGLGLGMAELFCLEAAELLECGVVVALGGVDAALEAGEFVALLGVGLAEGDVEDVESFLPELGFDGAETAEEPLAIDEGVDEQALLWGGGAEAVVILAGQGGEGGGVFATDELRLGVDAGFEGVHGGAGLALGGAGSGGFLRVEAIGLELLLGCHKRGG